MLIIVANQGDEAARRLASQWHPHPTAVLTPLDLSHKGWRYCLPSSDSSKAVVEGKEVCAKEITGVFTRMACVYPQELSLIVPEDRAYVAQEMNAFLAAWLSSLSCPVLNRPTPNCLRGPNWRREQWVRLAAQVGMPVCPVNRSSVIANATTSLEPAATQQVIVIGEQCIGVAEPQLHMHARNLARAAGTKLLAVGFTGPEDGSRFFDATLMADVSLPPVAAAIFNYMCGRPQC